MFRKSYKNAIDCVETNEELKSFLMKKAENAEKPNEAVKTEKTNVYKQGLFPKIRIYTLSGLATAAVLLIALNTFDMKKPVNKGIIQPNTDYIQTEEKNSKSGKKPKKAENILPSESQSVTDSEDEKKENEEKVKAPQNEKSEDTAFEKKEAVTPKNQIEKEKTEKSESAKGAEEALKAEDSGSTSEKIEKAEKIEKTENMPATSSDDNDEVQAYNDESENQMSLKGSLTAGSYSVRSLPNTQNEEWTKEKYCEYIGIDIEKMAKIPADMQNQTEKTVYIAKNENGDIINDYFNFVFAGENERYINISTEKNPEADNDWEKTVSENYISATKLKNGTQINVECYMLTEDEQNALLNSLS